jgi:hypothetical protein
MSQRESPKAGAPASGRDEFEPCIELVDQSETGVPQSGFVNISGSVAPPGGDRHGWMADAFGLNDVG